MKGANVFTEIPLLRNKKADVRQILFGNYVKIYNDY